MKIPYRTERRRRAPGVAGRLAGALLLLLVLAACDRGSDLSEFRISPDGELTDSLSAAPHPSFADLPVTPDAGLRPAPVDFASHPRARQFQSILTSGAAAGPDFAGHYTIVSWGCGALCQEFMIVDARNGEVFDGRTTALGVEYRLDSRLILVNPPTAAEAGRCNLPACAPAYFVWTGSRLEPVMLEDEREAIRVAAVEYIRAETAVGAVDIEVDAVAEGWARVRAIPVGAETDPAVMYLRKEGADWLVVALGTGFAPEDLDLLGVPPQARWAP